MVKDVVVLKVIVVQFLVSHGSIRSLTLPLVTTLSLCGDQGSSDEDVPVCSYELYVK